MALTKEGHSVNCYFCGNLVDERDCTPADDYNGGDGGDICPECQEGMFGYAEAETTLEEWDFHSLPDGERVIHAIEKGKQAIRDCLELGLNGYGD